MRNKKTEKDIIDSEVIVKNKLKIIAFYLRVPWGNIKIAKSP